MAIIQNKNEDLNAKVNKKITEQLSEITIQKMLLRFLTDTKITKLELARCLDITIADLLKLVENRASLELTQKISLPLVKFYCSTKFINQ